MMVFQVSVTRAAGVGWNIGKLLKELFLKNDKGQQKTVDAKAVSVSTSDCLLFVANFSLYYGETKRMVFSLLLVIVVDRKEFV